MASSHVTSGVCCVPLVSCGRMFVEVFSAGLPAGQGRVVFSTRDQPLSLSSTHVYLLHWIPLGIGIFYLF